MDIQVVNIGPSIGHPFQIKKIPPLAQRPRFDRAPGFALIEASVEQEGIYRKYQALARIVADNFPCDSFASTSLHTRSKALQNLLS